MPFDDDIRAALRREPAPSDFAAKVLARAAQLEKVVQIPVWRRPSSWALAAGLAIAALTPPAIVEYRHRQEEQRAIEARNQLMLALRITRTKLQQAKERVHRATARHAI
ncbi:MAG: hypothetical protein KGN84_07105 [Acidobacteriota bacterium]|nr:hypothetical protein [Acidobacteriota bacterium]